MPPTQAAAPLSVQPADQPPAATAAVQRQQEPQGQGAPERLARRPVAAQQFHRCPNISDVAMEEAAKCSARTACSARRRPCPAQALASNAMRSDPVRGSSHMSPGSARPGAHRGHEAQGRPACRGRRKPTSSGTPRRRRRTATAWRRSRSCTTLLNASRPTAAEGTSASQRSTSNDERGKLGMSAPPKSPRRADVRRPQRRCSLAAAPLQSRVNQLSTRNLGHTLVERP